MTPLIGQTVSHYRVLEKFAFSLGQVPSKCFLECVSADGRKILLVKTDNRQKLVPVKNVFE